VTLGSSHLVELTVIHSLDIEFVAAVKFLRNLALSNEGRNALEVGTEAFIDLWFFPRRHDLAFNHELFGILLQEDPHRKEDREDKHGKLRAPVRICCVVGENGVSSVVPHRRLVVENLRLTEEPVPKEAEEDGSPCNNLQRFLVQLVIVHGWPWMPVCNQDALHNIKVQESERGDRVEEGQGQAEHEGDEGGREDQGILVVH